MCAVGVMGVMGRNTLWSWSVCSREGKQQGDQEIRKWEGGDWNLPKFLRT